MNKEEFEDRSFFVGKIEEIKTDVFEGVTKINQYVKELERLTKIGKAFEDAKNKEFGILNMFHMLEQKLKYILLQNMNITK